jgi:flagellar protein FlaJ
MVTKMDKRARIAIVIGMVASTLLAAILGISLYRFLPPLFIASFAVIPMFFSGLYIQLQENKIKRKDDVYAAFVSSLGHSSETKSLEASKALDKLRHHDFGDLTKNINDLYTRLKTRIDSELSWKYFGSETGSNLISRFSHFYVEGAKQGGNGKQIANIISMTFTKMKSLRKMRYFSSESFTAIASFLVFMTAFVGYMSYFIMEKLLNIAKDIGTTNDELQQFEQVAMFNPNVSLDAFQAVVLLSLLINVVSAAAISRFTSGGHKGVSLMHIAFFTWVSAGAYFMVYVLLKLLIGI